MVPRAGGVLGHHCPSPAAGVALSGPSLVSTSLQSHTELLPCHVLEGR